MNIDWYIHLGWSPTPRCERVAIGDAPRFMRGLKLMFASDFHIRDVSTDKYIARLVHMLSSEGADMLLLGGDYAETASAAERLLRAIDPSHFPMGVYGVTGNNDDEAFEDRSKLCSIFPGKLLANETHVIQLDGGRLYIGGADDIKYGKPLNKGLFPAAPGGYSILLSHYPLPPAPNLGPRPRLMLSGHTHAGQIAFMGYSGYDFGMERTMVKAVCGMNNVDGIPLFVSSGIGMSRLPIRFCAAPRIHLFEFV